jgi:hypothetical protein
MHEWTVGEVRRLLSSCCRIVKSELFRWAGRVDSMGMSCGKTSVLRMRFGLSLFPVPNLSVVTTEWGLVNCPEKSRKQGRRYSRIIGYLYHHLDIRSPFCTLPLQTGSYDISVYLACVDNYNLFQKHQRIWHARRSLLADARCGGGRLYFLILVYLTVIKLTRGRYWRREQCWRYMVSVHRNAGI